LRYLTKATDDYRAGRIWWRARRAGNQARIARLIMVLSLRGRPMLDPDEYRRRAENCHQMARTATATKADLLEAAATWETLAQLAEDLRVARRELDRFGY
jgi:hypothetical protein